MDETEVGILLTAKNMASGALKQVQRDITGVQAAAVRSSNTLSRSMGGALTNIEKRLGGFRKNMGAAFDHVRRGVGQAAGALQHVGMMAGGLALVGGAMAVKWAGDFEAQMHTINTIARATPEQLKAIGDSLRKLSRDTGQDLNDLTGAYYDLLSAGVKTADAQGVLNQAVTLGIGGLGTTTETVDLLTTAYNVYGGGVKGAAKMTDEFAVAIERGKVKASDIANTYSNIAALAKDVGIGNDEIAASYARLTAAGAQPGVVATQMSSAISSLMKPNADLAALSKKTGENYLRIAKTQGLHIALEQIRKDAEKANIPLIKLFGRKEGFLYTLKVTGDNLAAYKADLDAVHKGEGTAMRQAKERQQGWNYELGRLKAGIKDAAITIGTELLPILSKVAEDFNSWLGKPEQQANLKLFAQDLAAGFKQVSDWVRTWDFPAITGALRTAADLAKSLIDAFAGAPDWLKTAIITGWGLNKITGGALFGVGGDLVKGVVGGLAGALGRQLFDRGSPGNPMYVVPVGGIGGAGGGVAGMAGKGGGVMGSLFKGIMAVSVVGMAAGIIAEMGNALAEGKARREEQVAGMIPQAVAAAQKATLPELVASRNKLLNIQHDDWNRLITGIASAPGIADVLGTKGLKEHQQAQIDILGAKIGQLARAMDPLSIMKAFAPFGLGRGAPINKPGAPPSGFVGDAPGATGRGGGGRGGSPAGGAVVRVSRDGARSIGEALNTHLREQTGALRRALTAVQGGSDLGQVRSAVDKSAAIGTQQLAALHAILARSRDIVVNVHPQAITLYVSGREIASAVTQEVTSRSPLYGDSNV